MSEKLTYSVKEAAELLGISAPKMYEICRIDGFPCIHIGRSIKIPKVEFREWISKKARGQNGENDG